MRRKFE
jgi:uncharacterized protein